MEIGSDIVEISRFANIEKDQKLLQKIFTKKEIEYCLSREPKAQHFAARFAAKEAVIKALSQLDISIDPQKIEIINDVHGRPTVNCTDPRCANLTIKISMSHSRTHAIAQSLICENNEQKKPYEPYDKIFYDSVWERYKILPTISSLAATTLVIATFNEKLIKITNFSKVLLAALLLLIPVSLFAYIFELHKAEKDSKLKMETASKISLKDLNKFTLRGYIPDIMTAILSLIIFFIVILIFVCK